MSNVIGSADLEIIIARKIVCDHCGDHVTRTMDCTSEREMLSWLNKGGWRIVVNRPYCSDCVTHGQDLYEHPDPELPDESKC